MTKKELVADVARRLATTKKEAERVVKEVIEAIQDGVVRDGKLQITDVFTIQARHVPARRGRNPKTGEPITIPARKQLFVKFGRGFKNRVNQ